jgi:hypothetical protein
MNEGNKHRWIDHDREAGLARREKWADRSLRRPAHSINGGYLKCQIVLHRKEKEAEKRGKNVVLPQKEKCTG